MKRMIMSAAAALLALCLVLAPAAPALAAGEDAAEAEKTYVLTYPNGEVVKTADKAEAEKLAGEWKLLYTGTTDEEGNIVLKDWAEKGEIRIVENKIPDGYTAEKTETVVDLSAGSVTIVNKKAAQQPKDTPKTGEAPAAAFLGLGACLSLAVLGLAVRRRNG